MLKIITLHLVQIHKPMKCKWYLQLYFCILFVITKKKNIFLVVVAYTHFRVVRGLSGIRLYFALLIKVDSFS